MPRFSFYESQISKPKTWTDPSKATSCWGTCQTASAKCAPIKAKHFRYFC